MQNIQELLEELPQHFDGAEPSEAAADRAYSFAAGFDQLAKEAHVSSGRGTVDEAMQQQLVNAVTSLSSYAAAASPAADGGAPPPCRFRQIAASTWAASSCMLLGATLELTPQAAYALGTACNTAFGPGHAILRSALAAPEQWLPVRSLLPFCSWQLLTVAVAAGLVLQPGRQPKAAAAFSASTCKPEVLMPWLAVLSESLLLNEGTTAADPMESGVIGCNYVSLLHLLLTAKPYARHREWLDGDAALQQAVVAVLVEFGLALLPEKAAKGLHSPGQAGTKNALQHLPELLQHSCLAAAADRHLQGPAAAMAVRHVAALLEALPQSRPANASAVQFGQPHYSAVVLLGTCCASWLRELYAADDGDEGSSNSGSGSASSEWGISQRQAAWQLVALVPRLVASLLAVADNGPSTPADEQERPLWLKLVETTCSNVATVLELLGTLEGQPASAAQLASWAEAATAGLRLQPTLLHLDGQFQDGQVQPAGDRAEADGARQLSNMLGRQLWANMPALSQPSAVTTEEATQLAASLRQLHATSCRLVHHLVACGSPVLAGCQSAGPVTTWSSHVYVLTQLFSCMIGLSGLAPSAFHAACIAHLQAVLAAAEAAVSAAGPAAAFEALMRCLAIAVQMCMRFCDVAWDSSTDAAFQRVAAHAAQADDALTLANSFLLPTAKAAALRPLMAAALASSSLRGRILQVVEQLTSSDDQNAVQTAARLLHEWEGAVQMLVDSVPGSAEAARLSYVPDAIALDLIAAAAVLHAHRQQVMARLGPDAGLRERAAELRQLLPPAGHLARLVLQWAHSPELESRGRLDVAKVAATRSCAYLRCANVAAQGGPAAGQGVGSARCSACRAVWYCGTACSHADWRAGHKRVCKALAAERQAAKAARAAARAAAAAEGAGAVEQQRERQA